MTKEKGVFSRNDILGHVVDNFCWA